MMRKECAKPLAVRGLMIGGKRPLVCLPLVAATEDDLVRAARKCLALMPDLLEWRVDWFAAFADARKVMAALARLRAEVDDLPLIFTCRDEKEGGARPITFDQRFSLMVSALASGMCDLLDVELAAGEQTIAALAAVAQATSTRLIISCHDFTATPDAATIVSWLRRARDLGGDVAKAAVTPQQPEDILTLLSATCKARQELEIPLITMAMGRDGRISRLAGGLFGSDVTFAAGVGASAPGQIRIGPLREAMRLLYPQTRKTKTR
ncbi:MAG: type I 3-dehydroquinate dehydratase [Desulfobulbaceae bacterium]|jgi:3-dehydroquinate dehydratase-1|nr:type I 3-dehydroquinate dehydratase [Desulfobulbaceae bacterium]